MGGIEVHLRELLRSQSRTYQVKALVAHAKSNTVREQIDGAEVIRVGSFGTIASMPICPSLPFYLGTLRGDLVHMHLPNPAAAFAYVVSACNLPLIITHHSDTMGRPNLRRLSDPFVRKAMDRASRIIATSERYARTSPELAPYMDKVSIVPLGIDGRRAGAFSPEFAENLRREFGHPIILSVGRLVAFKGFEFLIRAMENVPGVLLIIGDGVLRDHLKSIARNFGVSNRVFFLGNIDNSEVINYLHAADVFVLSSCTRAESFGIVQLEAMAAGLPVVNTSLDSGVPEVSLHGVTGLTVPPADPHALGEALRMLLSDDSLRATMGAAAKDRVRTHYSVDQMCSRITDIYSEVLG